VWLDISTYLVVWVFIVLTIMIGLQQVFAKGAVTANHLLGAVRVYLLAGVAWALAFRIVHRLDASAFVGITVAAPSEFLYLSFVTLATLGYGDIHPLNPMARMLAYMEAVVGQFYVAVLVATLVGRYVTSRGDSA
jgi:voltage-gated potassium channel